MTAVLYKLKLYLRVLIRITHNMRIYTFTAYNTFPILLSYGRLKIQDRKKGF